MRVRLLVAGLLACGVQRPEPAAPAPVRAATPEPAPEVVPVATHFAIRDVEVIGQGRVDLEIRDGRIAAIGAVDRSLPGEVMTGRFVVPAIVDSHVHLAYLPAGRELLAGGVAAAVDLGAPLAWLDAPLVPSALRLLASGPMITARRGYPTRDWGADGYGREVGGPNEAGAAVDELAEHGARVIKLAITGSPRLDERSLRAASDRAHARGLKVAAHALTDADAALAARVAVDVLAHAPVEPLTDATVRAWSGRAVISTLAAFGGSSAAVDNLRRLRAAGAIVLYGTDLGNTRDAGVSSDEIDLLRAAGLDGAAIVAAATSVPAGYWGLGGDEFAASVSIGAPASLLVLAIDPRIDPRGLAAPVAVYIAGAHQDGP